MGRGVNVLIADADGRLLLQLRDRIPGIPHPGKWSFFGGGLEPDEEPCAGALREMHEEVGIEGRPEDVESIGFLDDGMHRIFLVRYVPRVEKHAIALAEGAGFGYFQPADVARIDATAMTREQVWAFVLPSGAHGDDQGAAMAQPHDDAAEDVQAPAHALAGAAAADQDRACIFCRMVNGTVPAHIIWKDRDHLAFLDSSPCRPGHVLLIPGVHCSDVFELDEASCARLFVIARRLARPLKATMGSRRIGLVVEGFGVNHAHLHLIPISRGGELSSQHQTRADDSELSAIAIRLRQACAGIAAGGGR